MNNIPTSVFMVFIVVIGLFIIPLIALSAKNDDIAQSQLQSQITQFTDNARKKRIITQEDYDALVEEINNPNVYEVEITVNKLDENPAKKVSGSTVTIGDNIYYVMYTTQVLENLPLTLNQGDILTVGAKIKNQTLYDNLASAIFRTKKKNASGMYAQSSGLVN